MERGTERREVDREKRERAERESEGGRPGGERAVWRVEGPGKGIIDSCSLDYHI